MAKMKKTQNQSFASRVVAWLESALELSRAFERLLVDVLVAYVPLFAPLIPATIAFFSLYVVLKMPMWVSLIGAGVVEFLGLGTVTTTMQFVDYNASKKEDDPPAPTSAAIGTMIFYLVVVLTVNGLLDEARFIDKVAKLLLSTLSVAGAITISLRGQHARRVAEKAIRDAKAEEERKAKEADALAHKRQVAKERRDQNYELKKLALQVSEKKEESVKVSGKVDETLTEKPDTFGKWKTWRKVPHEEKLKIARMTMEQVVDVYGVEERTAYHWLEYAKRDTGIVGEVAQLQNELVFSVQETVEV